MYLKLKPKLSRTKPKSNRLFQTVNISPELFGSVKPLKEVLGQPNEVRHVEGVLSKADAFCSSFHW